MASEQPPSKVTHVSELGREPIFADGEQLISEERVEHGRVVREEKQLTHRLDELARDYYLFTFGPTYIVTRMGTDILYEFGKDLDIGEISVVSYRSPLPLFRGSGDFDFVLRGVPWELVRPKFVAPDAGQEANLLRKYALQVIMINRDVKPYIYWRVNVEAARIYTPGSLTPPTSIDVFLPTGTVGRCKLRHNPDGVFGFVKQGPEDWVVEESLRYFSETR